MRRDAAKVLVVYTIAWPMFWLGHAISRPMLWWDWAWLYPAYHWLMCRSSDIDDWAGGNRIWAP